MKPIRYDEAEVKKYTEKGWWTEELLSDFWYRNSEKYPDREALVDTLGRRLTFAEVKEYVRRIALGLIDLGMNKDDRIAIQLPNCVEGFLTRLACEKAGVISIALMQVYRHVELTEILGRIEAKAVVIPWKYRNFNYYEMIKEIAPQLPSLKHIIVVGDDVPEGAVSLSKIMQSSLEDKYPKDILEQRKMNAFEVCFLNSTTGTTGIPKIVEWTVAARLWSAKTHVRNWQLNSDDILCAIAPWPGAPGGTPTYFCAPQVGAKVVLLYEYTPKAALEIIQKEKVTVPCLVPAQLGAMMQEPVESYDLSSLRFIRCSGGYLSPPLAEEVTRRMKCPILITYGSQDTGSISGTAMDDPPEKKLYTVGKPLIGNDIKLVDDNGVEVPYGEIGQLYFRGPQSSGGYYRDPEKTFTEAVDSEGWATPGDLVKFDEDGYLVITGRKKDIIIRGGQNIYPGEIENFLIAHPKIADAAVVAMPDQIMGEKACAFVIPAAGSEPITFEEMVEYLKSKKLAMYKLPERLEIVDAFPLAGGSKINKVELRRMITEKLKDEGKVS
ncbi:MAG: AMP-binding protein [Firmicutes bacterium]|nr:AMP-binding protein [Bacillota bacterium]